MKKVHLQHLAALLVVLSVLALGFGRYRMVWDQMTAPTNADFFTSIRQGNHAALKRYLEQGGNPNQRDVNHRTALYLAEAYQQPEIKALLLQYGATADQTDPSGVEKRTQVSLNEPLKNYLQAIDQQKLRDEK